MMQIRASICLTAALLLGCAGFGASSLQVGQSAADAARALGPPNARHVLPSGGARLEFDGLIVSLSREGWLEIRSLTKTAPPAFELGITLAGGIAETQRLSVRAAPPARPISYIADFGDDLIDLFMNRATGVWRGGPLRHAPIAEMRPRRQGRRFHSLACGPALL